MTSHSRQSTRMNDRSREGSNFTIRSAPITELNYADIIAGYDAFTDAVEGVTRGDIVKKTRGDVVQLASPKAKADDPLAEIESKWYIEMSDIVNFKTVSMELPCANLDFCLEGTDEADMTAPEIVALVSAIESHHLSENLNPVRVEGIRKVGRDL